MLYDLTGNTSYLLFYTVSPGILYISLLLELKLVAYFHFLNTVLFGNIFISTSCVKCSRLSQHVYQVKIWEIAQMTLTNITSNTFLHIPRKEYYSTAKLKTTATHSSVRSLKHNVKITNASSEEIHIWLTPFWRRS